MEIKDGTETKSIGAATAQPAKNEKGGSKRERRVREKGEQEKKQKSTGRALPDRKIF